MSLTRVLAALQVALRNGALSFREYYRAEIDPLARDPLTMVWNRPHFERRRKATDRYALILIDIDNFKKINDSFGHHAGDVVLRAVASALRTNAGDRVFRVGGEEFAVLLAGCAPADAAKVAERLRAKVRELELLDGAPVTISVGVAWTGANPGEASVDHDSVYKKADRALYHAKGTGKNRVALFERAGLDDDELIAQISTVLPRSAPDLSDSSKTIRPWK